MQTIAVGHKQADYVWKLARRQKVDTYEGIAKVAKIGVGTAHRLVNRKPVRWNTITVVIASLGGDLLEFESLADNASYDSEAEIVILQGRMSALERNFIRQQEDIRRLRALLLTNQTGVSR